MSGIVKEGRFRILRERMKNEPSGSRKDFHT